MADMQGGGAPGEVPPELAPEPASAATLLLNIKQLLQGQDLTAISLGTLRQQLIQRLGLQPQALDHRRDEIISLAQQAIQEMNANRAEPVPDWATPADETARLMVYFVTFSSILQDTSGGNDAPLRTPRV